jgi:chromosome segregation ATPase
MEDLDFILKSKDKIKSLQSEIEESKKVISNLQKENKNLKSENEDLKSVVSQCQKEVKVLDRKSTEALEAVSRKFDEANNLIEQQNQLLQKIKDIIYEEKYDEWVDSPWRLMERTDFEEFLKELRAVFEE